MTGWLPVEMPAILRLYREAFSRNKFEGSFYYVQSQNQKNFIAYVREADTQKGEENPVSDFNADNRNGRGCRDCQASDGYI